MSTQKNSIHIDYVKRINRVFEYIDEHLDGELNLTNLSEIAHFSPFHFHRIFKFITSETINEYINRRRIEKAVLDLLHKEITIAEIANKYGFSEVSSFSRTFKRYYQVSPTEFKKQNDLKYSKIRQLNSKIGQEHPSFETYICILNELKNWIPMNAKIEVKEMPEMKLAYVPCIGSQNLGMAYGQIMKWATPLGLMNEQTKMITIYHDSFKVTEPTKVRMSACILLNQEIQSSNEIGFKTIQSSKCIVGRFEIILHEFEKAWTGLFIWMNENGFKKADKDPFEIYHSNPENHPEKKAMVDLCIPIY